MHYFIQFRKIFSFEFWPGNSENFPLCDATWRTQFNSSLPCWLLIADGLRELALLAAEYWVCHRTVLHILQDILGYHKLAARWIHHEISEVQKWHRYAVAQAMLDQYQREGDDFLGRIVAMDETWARSYEPNLKRKTNERKCAIHNVL